MLTNFGCHSCPCGGETLKTRYIHIGYPKTGTTALQMCFFNHQPEVLHLGYPYISPEIQDCIQIDILRKDGLTYMGHEVKAKFAPYLAKADSNPRCRAVGISAEELSFSLDGTGADRTLISVRLRHIFGEAKIIITIRNQFDFIGSLYGELIKGGCYFSFKQFLEAHYWRFYTYLFHQILYRDVFKWYERIFGEGQVKIILFEDFKNDPHKTLNELCSFLGISPPVTVKNTAPSNPNLSSFSLMMARFFNYIFRNDWGRPYFMPLTPGALTPGMAREINFIPRGILKRDSWRRHSRYTLSWMDRKFNLRSSNVTFSEEWKERINNLYRENNRRLMEETGLDLRKYNYPL